MPFDLLCCVRPGVEDVQELDYSHQSLSDVPTEVFVYERTLERLLCHSNRIAELPRQLFMCHGLKSLDLSDNEIQQLPAAISSLVNLRHLNLSKNAITSLPDTMKCLKHLTFLDLSVNPLEKMPEAITNLIALNELYLNDTYLEYLPGNFGRLSNLKILELRDNYLMILPKSLARSTELMRLDIGQNEFQEFPEVIGKFSKLRELWIDCNSLTSIPSTVKALTSLGHLEAGTNLIEDVALEISYCSELIELSLSSNNLTQLPESIGNLTKLVTLKLDHNKLFSLPDSIGQMKDLEEFMLMSNYLDRLPSSLGMLRKLKYLNVDENLLRSLPTEIGSCTKLSVLSVRSNKLTEVPSEIGRISALRVLNLVRNSLSCLPQTLLNCDNLVALWLSENQSKPLVPMQSEMNPQTYQQVLTCFLFPQVPLSPVEYNQDDSKNSGQDNQVQSRHISFVDMKAAAKAPEKPGQLRRAPTPYPKELRALAKHARNVQKEGAQDVTPPVHNTVHIKAAKITPTLQQRFADDNKINQEDNGNTEWAERETVDNTNKECTYEITNNENPYDRPLDLNGHKDKSYQSVDHALYSESNDSAYGGLKDVHQTNHPPSDMYTDRKYQEHSVEDRVDGIIHHTTHDLYQKSDYHERGNRRSNDTKYYSHDYGTQNIQNTPQDFQRMSIASQEQNSNVPHSHSLAQFENCSIEKENKHTYHIPGIHQRQNYDKMVPVLKEGNYGQMRDEQNYHDSIYEGESYAQAKEKIYGRRRNDVYNYHPHTHKDILSSRSYGGSKLVSSSTTMPNISQLDNSYKSTNGEGQQGQYYSGPLHQSISPNGNIYSITESSPQFRPTQSPELYSPTGHNDMTNPYRMTNTPLITEDPAYVQRQIHGRNTYSIYESVPAANSHNMNTHPHSPASSVHSDSMYARGQPPPYHIAAAYTKQAQYFNGPG